VPVGAGTYAAAEQMTATLYLVHSCDVTVF